MANSSSRRRQFIGLDYRWTIEKFGDLPWKTTKLSQPFTFGPKGSHWCLHAYCKSEGSYEHIYLDLCKMSNVSQPTRVKINVSIIAESAEHPRMEIPVIGNGEFETYSKELPVHSFHLMLGGYRIGEVYSNGPIIDRYFSKTSATLLCKLTMEKPIALPECSDSKTAPKKENLSDVTLVSKGKEFKSLKMILSSKSPVFAAKFKRQNDEKQEKSIKRVEIDDIEPKVLAEMLQWIYTDKSPNLVTMAPELLSAADKYELEGLKTMCKAHLESDG